jgi:hypothetical protein
VGRRRQACAAVLGEANSGLPDCKLMRRLQGRAACKKEFSQPAVSCLPFSSLERTKADLWRLQLQSGELDQFADPISIRTGSRERWIILARLIVNWMPLPLLRSIKHSLQYPPRSPSFSVLTG